MATLIMTAKLNDIDPQAWLADVLARIAGVPQSRLHELLQWEWKCARPNPAAHAGRMLTPDLRTRSGLSGSCHVSGPDLQTARRRAIGGGNSVDRARCPIRCAATVQKVSVRLFALLQGRSNTTAYATCR